MYRGCGGWGTFAMFNVDVSYGIRQVTSQYFSAQLLTLQWAEPVDENHMVYPAESDIKDSKGHVLVTAYSVLRPDGQWALLLVNKDENNPHSVQVEFHDASGDSNHYFSGNVDQISFGADNYTWHADGQNGDADPDGPAVTSNQNGGKGVEYALPRASITVLRGNVQ
jgi:hypothetical protein